MKTTYITILVFSLSAAGCSAMLEFKDYGNNNNPNPDCGNGVVDGNEECDDGAANSDELADACRTDCRSPYCGDNVTDDGEVCDSGPSNGQPERCNEACDGYVVAANCGNGVLEPGEECDGAQGTECEAHGYLPGTAECGADCHLNVTQCGSPNGCVPADALTCSSGTIFSSTLAMGSRDSVLGYCENFGRYYTGREIVYSFTSPERRLVNLQLHEIGGDQDLLVMIDDGSMCATNECVGASVQMSTTEEQVSFVAEAYEQYLIVVDGREGHSGGFGLSIDCPLNEDCADPSVDENLNGLLGCDDPECAGSPPCTPGPETSCWDGLDNDGDDLIDCQDNDCISAGSCVCNAVDVLSCGDQIPSQNYGPNTTDRFIAGWCGHAFVGTTGPEHVYRLQIPTSVNSVNILVSNMTADVDAFLLEDPNNNMCQINHCVTGVTNPVGGLADEQIDFTPNHSTTYFLAVDGWMWAMAEYDIAVTCSP